MTRYLIGNPGAAHSAKNATAPGLPNQPANDVKGSTPMVSQELLSRASRRTGYRVALVAAPVQIIAHRHRDGHSLAQITRYLHGQLGPDSPVASRTFVAWVIEAAERGEA